MAKPQEQEQELVTSAHSEPVVKVEQPGHPVLENVEVCREQRWEQMSVEHRLVQAVTEQQHRGERAERLTHPSDLSADRWDLSAQRLSRDLRT